MVSSAAAGSYRLGLLEDQLQCTVAVAFIVLGSLVDFYGEILNTFLICIGDFLCGFRGYYS